MSERPTIPHDKIPKRIGDISLEAKTVALDPQQLYWRYGGISDCRP